MENYQKKIPKIMKFWNCSYVRYSAPFAISPIFILPFDINSGFYCSRLSSVRPFFICTFVNFQIRNISRSKNFEQSNFRITKISNLKINEPSYREEPNLRATTLENENWEEKESKFGAEYRMDRQSQNFLIFGISIVFQV